MGWFMAGCWGWLAGGALLIGAALGWLVRLPVRAAAAVMAFGSGVLLSALSFELMEEAQRRGGLMATAAGFLAGAAVFTGANWLLARRGAKHRKRSNGRQPSESQDEGSGAAIALGALLDGIPESIVIGTSMLAGKGVSIVAVAAIFLSNVPEGLSSSTGMKKGGRSALYVFGLWAAIAFLSGVASIVGFVAFRDASAGLVALVTAIAAGAILAMLIDTMIPEAFEESHALAGLVAVAGFLCAFALSKSSDDDARCTAHQQSPGSSDVGRGEETPERRSFVSSEASSRTWRYAPLGENGRLPPICRGRHGADPVTCLLAATHRDLRKPIAEGTFRDDPFHRTSVIELAERAQSHAGASPSEAE